MYWWKCWRDARLGVGLYGFVIILTIWSVMRHGSIYLSFNNEGRPVHNAWAASVYLDIFVGVLAFVAWLIGSTGIGRDIGEGNGAFMLTWPRPRRYFVWWNVGICLGLLVLLACLTTALFEIGVYFKAIRFGGGTAWAAASVHGASEGVPALAILLLFLSGLIFAGLIYSVTYLCTVIAERGSMGLMMSGGFFAGYFWLYVKNMVPSLRVNPYPNPFTDNHAPHVWLERGARAVVVAALLLIAQAVLERREVRA